MDEEALARRVERRVMRAAQAAEQRAVSSQPADEAIAPLSPPPSSARAQDWGGLPAPWEPLPSWMSASSETEPLELRPTGTDLTDISPVPSAPIGGPTAPLHRAEHGRQLGDDTPAAALSPTVPAAERAEQVQPDLDALARQVYAILKRRLAEERRREFFS
jgi:hypothetical protein